MNLMRKRTLYPFRIFPLMVMCAFTVQAQPRWLQDLVDTLSIPAVDREASVLILLHEIGVEFSQDGRAGIHVRIAMKVLQPSGTSLVRLSETVSEEREMDDIDGWLIARQGKVTELADDNIMEVSTSGFEGHYHADRTIVAGFPGVKVGDIIAYEYEIDDREPFSSFQRFRLQSRQPARHIRLEVVVPVGWSLHSSTWRMETFHTQQVGNRTMWTGVELPYEPDEPLMPSLDYLAREIQIAVTSPSASDDHQFTDWASVARWSHTLLKGAVAVDPEVRAVTQRLVGDSTKPSDRIRAIARFVSTDIRYVAVELEKGRWEPRPAPMTLRNRFGDCKDKTALMRAMLLSAGIPSHAVLLNTRIVINRDLPTPFQFNHCILSVPSRYAQHPEDTSGATASPWVFYDPTDMNASFGMVPQVLQGNSVLLLRDSSSELIRIPMMTPELNTTRLRGDFTLQNDGSISGSLTVTHIGMAALDERFRNRVVDRERLREDWVNRVRATIKDASLTNFRTVDMKDSLQTSFDVSASGYLSVAGNTFLLKANPFNAMDVSPFVKDTRHHPIWFGEPGLTEKSVRWMLPRGWKATTDVGQLRASCPTGDVSTSVSSMDSVVTYVSIARQTGALLHAGEYAVARKFRSDMSLARNVTLFVSKR